MKKRPPQFERAHPIRSLLVEGAALSGVVPTDDELDEIAKLAGSNSLKRVELKRAVREAAQKAVAKHDSGHFLDARTIAQETFEDLVGDLPEWRAPSREPELDENSSPRDLAKSIQLY